MDVPDVVPLFALPDHVLLIGLPTPYRVFEPRYRALVDDLLGREPAQRWVAIPRLAPGWQADYEGAPAFHPIAAVGLARNIRPLEEGQFMMVVEGLLRCHLTEVPSPHPFRLVQPSVLPELPPAEDGPGINPPLAAIMGLVADLRRRLGARGAVLAPLLEQSADPGALVDRLGAALLGDVDARQAFLEARGIIERMAILHSGLSALLALRAGRTRWDPSAN